MVRDYLPQPPPKVVGIDLGTTYSSVGYFKNGVGVEIIADAQGRTTFPSVVAFTDKGVLVGYEAKEQIERNPANTIFDAKRFIGKSADDPQVQRDAKLYPFEVVTRNGAPHFAVQFEGRRQIFSPEDISAFILKKMKSLAESHFGRAVKEVVLAVPGEYLLEFEERQRNATADAAAVAGLKLLRIISEPTSAAMAYGIHKKDQVDYVVVFDFGGGTLDVSLLSVVNSVFEVVAVRGDQHLGGEDFNNNLVSHFVPRIAARHSANITTSKENSQRLLSAVELLKIELSSSEEATLSFTTEEGLQVSESLTRSQFEDINRELFERALVPVREVIEEGQIPKNEVDEIVMVGGSSRIPQVRRQLKEFFGGKQPNVSIDPELAVVIGTSIQAGIVSDSWPMPTAAVERPSSRRCKA